MSKHCSCDKAIDPSGALWHLEPCPYGNDEVVFPWEEGNNG